MSVTRDECEERVRYITSGREACVRYITSAREACVRY